MGETVQGRQLHARPPSLLSSAAAHFKHSACCDTARLHKVGERTSSTLKHDEESLLEEYGMAAENKRQEARIQQYVPQFYDT